MGGGHSRKVREIEMKRRGRWNIGHGNAWDSLVEGFQASDSRIYCPGSAEKQNQ